MMPNFGHLVHIGAQWDSRLKVSGFFTLLRVLRDIEPVKSLKTNKLKSWRGSCIT